VKSRREASTSMDAKNAKTVATETNIMPRKHDAATVTDTEEEEPVQFTYHSRKSRYSEWETSSMPTEPEYRLEMLTKSPRTVHKK
jgi:hypothetical protein